ncbi:MAG: helix-turn-helix transcriptional regulator [Myxococcota bacterium]
MGRSLGVTYPIETVAGAEAMQLTSRTPRCPQLRGVVRSLWHYRAPGARGRQHMLPSGVMQLIVNLEVDALRYADADDEPFALQSGTLIQGMQSRAVVLDRRDQRDVLGVVFEPGAGRVVLGTPLDAVTNTHVALHEVATDGSSLRDSLLGAATAEARFDRVERWLAARVRGEVDAMVRAALGLMRRGEQRVRVLASSLGTSEQALRRRFRAEVGLPPKQMSRVLRLQRALDGLRGAGSLAEVALSSGYHDQAHLTHEMRELAGVSPSDYRRRQPVYRNHLD